jgi:sec-independent protein translocase protein TatB
MFDVGASELLVIVVVAVVVIGPKDLPLAMRTAGRWIARIRRVSNHFRAGIETMIREAELEEMERKWREQNDAIMKAKPIAVGDPRLPPASAKAELAEAMPEGETIARGAEQRRSEAETVEPQLPLPPP